MTATFFSLYVLINGIPQVFAVTATEMHCEMIREAFIVIYEAPEQELACIATDVPVPGVAL